MMCIWWEERGRWMGHCKRVDEVASGFACVIGRGEIGHGKFVGKKFDGVADSFTSGGRDVNTIASIVFEGRTKVASWDTVRRP
jgi:hypothetical protein